MRVQAYGLSDVGRVRETNEDQFLVDESMGLYAVADGMGGHAAGEIASELAIQSLAERMRDAFREGRPDDISEARLRLESAIAEANRRICESIEGHDERRGMGTTMVALVLLPAHVVIGHVGDSRAYLLRDAKLKLLTSDHSWVNEQVRLGLLTQRDAHRHPMRNVVTRALGSREEVRLELTEETLRPGDAFLLCSDGLNVMLTDEEIRSTLVTHRGDPQAACRALVEAANQGGGEDNTTVIMVMVS